MKTRNKEVVGCAICGKKLELDKGKESKQLARHLVEDEFLREKWYEDLEGITLGKRSSFEGKKVGYKLKGWPDPQIFEYQAFIDTMPFGKKYEGVLYFRDMETQIDFDMIVIDAGSIDDAKKAVDNAFLEHFRGLFHDKKVKK